MIHSGLFQAVLCTQERKLDEWDALHERSTFWQTMRVIERVLRFINNCKARRNKFKKALGPLLTYLLPIMPAWHIGQQQNPSNPAYL